MSDGRMHRLWQVFRIQMFSGERHRLLLNVKCSSRAQVCEAPGGECCISDGV